jgi:hypothetical protein
VDRSAAGGGHRDPPHDTRTGELSGLIQVLHSPDYLNVLIMALFWRQFKPFAINAGSAGRAAHIGMRILNSR